MLYFIGFVWTKKNLFEKCFHVFNNKPKAVEFLVGLVLKVVILVSMKFQAYWNSQKTDIFESITNKER